MNSNSLWPGFSKNFHPNKSFFCLFCSPHYCSCFFFRMCRFVSAAIYFLDRYITGGLSCDMACAKAYSFTSVISVTSFFGSKIF